ncbi:MAG: YraN family protein, partial [Vampirovibrionales bacterium]|nr:YraN family protein [Vampirovibrionales bacterium]
CPLRRLFLFIEVKTRLAKTQHQGLFDGLTAVTPAKQRQLIKLAERYLAKHPLPTGYDVRFDVIAVSWIYASWQPALIHSWLPLPNVLWVPNAFDAS